MGGRSRGRVISAMRKSLAAVLAAAVVLASAAVVLAVDPSAPSQSPYVIKSFLGNIELNVAHSEAIDLGTYSYSNAPCQPIPTPVNLAALKMEVSKTLSSKPSNPDVPPDTVSIGVWARTPDNRTTALLTCKVAEGSYAYSSPIYVDPYRNTPRYICNTARFWSLINSSYGKSVSVTFTAEDFEPALAYLKQSAGNLEVFGVDAYGSSHLYTEECTTVSVRCTGLYGFAGMSIASATINGVEYPVEGGTVKLSGPVSGTLTLNLEGRLFFIPYSKTVTFQI